jgi:uncharacterized protein (TIGR00369 family)
MQDPLTMLRQVNATAEFNRWSGIEVVSADQGSVVLAVEWRKEFGQYAGYLHAGMIAALIDTACGFAAATISGQVLASTFTVNCLRPAVGDRFVARARVIKPGRKQIFTACDLYAVTADGEKLVANGQTLLCPAA